MKKDKKEEPLMLEGEIWKPIFGYEGIYEVSNMGRVKSLNYLGHNRVKILRINPIKGGYFGLHLYKNSKKFFFLIHRLVYESFIGYIPKWNPRDKGDVKMEINHKDENKANNRLDNLELITKTENNNYGTRTKRQSAKLTKSVYQYSMDGELIKFWEGGAPECEKYGFNRSCIWACCNGRHPHHKGFKWSYNLL